MEEGEKSCVFRQLRSVTSKSIIGLSIIDLWDSKKPLFYFFQTELATNYFIIQSVRLICLLCNLLDPDAKTQITLSELAHAQSSPKSFFFCPWAFTVLYFSRKRLLQNPRSSRSAFQGISVGLWNKSFVGIFLVKVTLFVAHFLDSTSWIPDSRYWIPVFVSGTCQQQDWGRSYPTYL